MTIVVVLGLVAGITLADIRQTTTIPNHEIVLAQHLNEMPPIDDSEPCPVTFPPKEKSRYENESLGTGLWPNGIIEFKLDGPGFILADGSLKMKFWWWRYRPGSLVLEGRRLDGPSPPMRSVVPHGYGDIGFQATSLIFPTPGCWQVTGRIGDDTLIFVTLVEKVGFNSE